MKAWIAVVNPHAGTFRSSRFVDRWLPELRRLVDDVVFTAGPGDGTGLASAASGYGGIVAVGGDGSIADVIAGMDLQRQRLSVLPTGRGNTLARELGIGTIERALSAIRDGTDKQVDLMRARLNLSNGVELERLGSTTIGIGYTATVVRRATSLRPLGRLAYGLVSIITRPQRFRVDLTTDTGIHREDELTGMIVNNTRFLANFLALREASPSDGRLDLMLLRTGWFTQIVHNLSVLSGLHFYQPAELLQAGETALGFAEPQTVMMDGDLIDEVAAMTVTAMPRAVTVRSARPA